MIYLIRERPTDQGTPGVMFAHNWWAYSLELPWRHNRQNLSCIPPGIYPIEYVNASRKIGGRSDLYLIKGVPGRSGILIHAGTWAGDKTKGLKTNSAGCPLIGKSRGSYRGQRAIFNSRKAVAELIEILNRKPNQIRIIDGI